MPAQNRKNLTLAFNLLLIAVGMLALAFASVPLYRMFCQVTGYGGTTRQSASAPRQVLGREITILFNADTDPHLPWSFKPSVTQMKTRIGQQTLTHYVAHNNSNEAVTGRATYNVVPFTAGPYFSKIECFCFTEQTLEAGQSVNMPILFYIDPSLADAPEMKDVNTITLSYTFFPVKNEREPTSKP
jgi:cytochrome c oxidase assembly protein subunit 11